MIAIDLGHRYGRVARVGPDGRPEVTTTELAGVDGVLDPVRALPLLLGSSRAAEDSFAVEPDRAALIGLPVSGGREDELRYAVERAGLDVARVVPEPVAAALHYGAIAEGVDHTVLVCDQGATTLDLSVLAIAPDLTVHVVRALSLPLGGDAWDAAVAAELNGGLPEGADPLGAARTLRQGLDGSDVATGSVEDAVGEHHPLTLERTAFERAVGPLRERVLAAVAEQLTTAEPAVDTVLLMRRDGRRARAAGRDRGPPGRAGPFGALRPPRTGRRAGAVVTAGLRRSARRQRIPRAVGAGRSRVRETGRRSPARGSRVPRPGRPCGLTDPEPAVAATDPEPRTGRSRTEDPEPGSRQGGASAVQDAGQTAEQAGPGGLRSAFEPVEPEEAGQPYAQPPHTGAPHAPHAEPGYADAPPAEPPYTEAPRPEAPYAGPPPAEPSYAGPPEPGAAHTAAPTEAAEPPSPGPGAAAPPGHGSPYDTTAGAPTGSATEPRVLFAVPVDQLQFIRRGDHLLVLWAWPEGALSARVRWRREGGTAAAGPGDGDVVSPAPGVRARRRVRPGRGPGSRHPHRGGAGPGAPRGLRRRVLTARPRRTHRRRVRAGRAPAVSRAGSLRSPSPRRRAATCPVSASSTASAASAPPVPPREPSCTRCPRSGCLPAAPMTVEFPLPATRGPSWLVCFPADAGAESGIDIRPTALHRLRVT